MKKFTRYMYETRKNKIYSLALLGLSTLLTIVDGDATFLVFSSFIAVPMFFARTKWIY